MAQTHGRSRNAGTIDSRLLPSLSPLTFSNLKFWWDFPALGQSNGTAITSVPDRSGNGIDLSQPTAGNQPTFEANSKNGLGVALWDTTPNDWMKINGTTGVSLSTTHTIYALVKTPASLSAQGVLFSNPSDGNYQGLFWSTGTQIEEKHTSAGASATSGIATNTWYIMIFTRNAGAWDYRINAGSTSSGTCGTSSFTTTQFGGTNGVNSFSGWRIGEAFGYDRVLNSTEISSLRDYLNKKWLVY